MIDPSRLLEQTWNQVSGEAAWQVVADISRCHRIQASPGYRQAAGLVSELLRRAGLSPETLTYPADERTAFWAWPSFQEWSCTQAELRLVSPAGQAGVLAEFQACPISVIQRSAPFEGEAEVVVLEDGTAAAEYDGIAGGVEGKLVLTRGEVRRVWEQAVQQHGALGILYDGMRAVPPIRPEGDLADARQYTSFWWQSGDKRCFGFVLTPRQGQHLRRLVRDGKEPVRVWARIESRAYDGTFEVVSAAIPGQGRAQGDEVLMVAHLCHPLPSANDNASGAAAAVEAARALQALIAAGHLPPPRRTIRFLWLPEMTGTYAYLAGREAELEQLVGGINLDMVGEDQGQTGSAWLIESPPAAAPSFAAGLLACLRDKLPTLPGMADVSAGYTGEGRYPLYRHAETPFLGGSDHAILADPSVGVPTPMLIQWPDRFYHTSADTPDRTDPNSLRRAATLAAAYVYWLAAAGPHEVAWLGHEMLARFKARLVQTAQEAVTDCTTAADAETLANRLGALDRRLAFLLDREQVALATLDRLAETGCLGETLAREASRAAYQELEWAREAAGLCAVEMDLDGLPEPPPHTLDAEEQRAAELVPVRRVRGPIPLRDHLRRLSAGKRDEWQAFLAARETAPAHSLMDLALYWADGARSILDIAGLVELEAGHRDVGLLLAYLELLHELGFIEFKPAES